MKTALILGLTGNFGQEMAKALNQQGWNIRAIVRSPEKLNNDRHDYEIITGNYQDSTTLHQALSNIDLIVYALNPPYNQWAKEAMAMLEPVVRVAEQKQLQLLFPGNVYTLKPGDTQIDEHALPQANTAKGKIRMQMESRLRLASKSGARVTIIRAGDFIGKDAQWLSMILKQKANGYMMRFPHTAEHRHCWSYLPDLCANAAQLLSLQTNTFEVWHDPGLVLTRENWVTAFEQNGLSLKADSFPWWQLKLLTPFNVMAREVIMMRYLWQQPLLLNGRKMQAALGKNYQSTPLTEIVKALVKTH